MKKITPRIFEKTEKEKEWHQVFGEEATKWFNVNCYWIAWRYKRSQIDYAWSIAEKENDHTLSHFIQNLNK